MRAKIRKMRKERRIVTDEPMNAQLKRAILPSKTSHAFLNVLQPK
jgi:hypothetical protein